MRKEENDHLEEELREEKGKWGNDQLKRALTKRGCGKSQLALLVRKIQFQTKLREVLTAEERRALDTRAAVLKEEAEQEAATAAALPKKTKKRKRKVAESSEEDEGNAAGQEEDEQQEIFVMASQLAPRARQSHGKLTKATFHHAVSVSWQAAQSFAVQCGLTLVDFDANSSQQAGNTLVEGSARAWVPT